jgi:RNA polymerase sigma-70 factor (ECF subfamily)
MAEEFDQIIREYQDKIFRLAFSMLGERGAAEETAQDVLVRVWKGLPGFRAESSLSTWIYAITRNACLSVLKRRNLRPVSLDEPAPRREVEQKAAGEWAAVEFPEAAELLNRLPAK